ncbi:unnamed protein product [Coregonus sp. 'balchen']|nr:unnamed protein product [Coregonus sp. 'balchen']
MGDEVSPMSFMSHTLGPLREQTLEGNNFNDYPHSARPLENLNIPLKPGLPETECMTEACLNQSLDALLACSLLMREDYELVVNRATRTAKVRQLLDTCHRHSEDFCRVVVRRIQDNKQLGLQPYPPEVSSLVAAPNPRAPPLSVSYNNPRNY